MKHCACLTRCAASNAGSPDFWKERASGAAATSTFRTRVEGAALRAQGAPAPPNPQSGTKSAASFLPAGDPTAELMRIDLGAKGRTKDGHETANVRRVIIDPAT